MKNGEGRDVADPRTLDDLVVQERIMARYVAGPEGATRHRDRHNPNGSLRDIAAIRNEAGNVVEIMPHPETRSRLTGPSVDGLEFFTGATPPRCARRRRRSGCLPASVRTPAIRMSETVAVTSKVESHDHPSFVEPYQGGDARHKSPPNSDSIVRGGALDGLIRQRAKRAPDPAEAPGQASSRRLGGQP